MNPAWHRRGLASPQALVALVALAGCMPKHPPLASPFARNFGAEMDAEWSADRDQELASDLEQLMCREEAEGPAPIVEDQADKLEHARPATLLAFAARASRCASPEAARMVFRGIPTHLLRRFDGKELSVRYAFLMKDRAHSLALFRTMLQGELEADLPGEPAELERSFHPEQVLRATCEELDGLDPRVGTQFHATMAVLERNQCEAQKRPLVLRGLKSTSSVREAVCSWNGALMIDMAAEVREAAFSDTGIIEYEPHEQVGRNLLEVIGNDLKNLGEPGEIKAIHYPGRQRCALLAERLQAAR